MDRLLIEKKWQEIWKEQKLYDFDKSDIDNKYYVLEMFSYPSGANLHVGHWYNYGPSDSYARFEKMCGKNVFQPMGFDAFGLPAENYAIKTGIHPEDSTLKNIQTMEKQLQNIGASFDWNYEIKTCTTDYYKWTQWLFLKLFEKGLAYRKNAPVNYCTSCGTVLANEQVLDDGTCERCGSVVVKKNLTQWFFKITDYAEELLEKLDTLDWPQKTKLMQKNWIGKSTGAEVQFDIVGSDKSFSVFTTRADTLFGVSFVVLAPEHPLVDEITTAECKDAVETYKFECSKVSEIDRISSVREKTGVFCGRYATNPINGKQVPIYIADYVLYSYGTGAVMAVPAHDERDFVFAKKYNLPIERVIEGYNGEPLPYCEYGKLIASGKYSGLSSEEAKNAIPNDLNSQGKGEQKVNYRLRDWLVSRQRYWGCPIPIIHCEHCGIVPVPEKDLPVVLPYDVEFRPDGKSPLAKCESFYNTTCPKCGKKATREVDTLDTFVCSSWYFLRYPDAQNSEKAFDSDLINKMLPVDKYIGGAEHACMHLLYARFFTKALRDIGLLEFDEPFISLVHQGTILGPDGNKMSKSRGNVISPDTYIAEYGSDVFRMYLMFGFSYIDGGAWSDDGIKAISKFLDRCERIVLKAFEKTYANVFGSEEKELDYARNYCIKAVTNDMRSFSFNTAIARIMEFVNALYKYEFENDRLVKECAVDLLKLLAPITPHFSEELFSKIKPTSIFREAYPVCNETALVRDEIEYAVQINSKLRGKITLASTLTNTEIEAEVKKLEIAKNLNVVKIIIVPKRLINIIAK